MNPGMSVSAGQMPVSEILSDLSSPSSPESEMYDATEILGTTVHDDVTHQLAAAGPVGVAAAAAVLSTRKRKHPHHFETNPARRKRQQTRLLRKLRHTIEEFSARVGQQAVVLCCTPNINHSMQIYKVFGSQPLEGVIRNQRSQILQDLDTALLEQTPSNQQENSHLHELPSLVIEGMPTPVNKMTQAQLRNFIPEMLKYSTGRSKPGWGRLDCRPVWWPSDLPWANVRSDVRSDEEKKRVPWTEALRQIVKNCYMHHGRQDLLQVFKEEQVNMSNVSVQPQPFAGTMMQTINNPDGTVSIIQIDPGPSQVVTLPDGTQATVVHAMDPATLQHVQQQQQQDVHVSGTSHQFTTELSQQTGAQIVTSAGELGVMAAGNQAGTISALHTSGGHIILTGADASQLGGIMTVLPVSMYQTMQGVTGMQAVQTAVQPMTTLPVNFQLAQTSGDRSSQPIEIGAMTPVTTGDVSIVMNPEVQSEELKGHVDGESGDPEDVNVEIVQASEENDDPESIQILA